MQRERRTSLKEIAELCGVSKATVSLVLNGSPLVADSTRRKVQTVLDSVQYRPHRLARALAGKATGTIGAALLTCSNPAPPYHLAFIEGMVRAATRYGIDLHVRALVTKEQGSKADTVRRLLEENYIDGLALISDPDLSPADLKPIEERDLPFILLNNTIDGADVPGIVVDNAGAVAAAVEYLHSLGHSSVAYVHRPKTRRAYQDRLRGFYYSCAALGMHWYKDLPVDDSAPATTEVYEHWWLSSEHLPTAILCTDTLMALHVRRALDHLQVRIPEEISLMSVGSADTSAAEADAIGLTRLQIPNYDMGETAVKLLLELINGEAQQRLITFTPALLEGSSCGPQPTSSQMRN